LQAAAAKVPGHAVDRAEAHQDPFRGQLCLAGTRKHLDRRAARDLGPGDKVWAVGGFAHRCRCHGTQLSNTKDVRDSTEASQSRKRTLDRRLTKHTRGRHGPAEAAEHLLVENRCRRADSALVNNETHRVRAYVDDADRLQRARPRLARETKPFHTALLPQSLRVSLTRGGMLSLSACPRPERLGLVMK